MCCAGQAARHPQEDLLLPRAAHIEIERASEDRLNQADTGWY